MAENKKPRNTYGGEVPLASPDANPTLQPIHKQIGIPSVPRRVSMALEYRQSQILQKVHRTYNHELEQGLAFHLVPVLVGLGIVAYFAAPAEPVGLILLGVFSTLVISAVKSNATNFSYRIVTISICIVLGMLAGKLSVLRSDDPVISSQLTGQITGTVIAVDANARGSARYIIVPHQIEGMAPEQLPRYVRISSPSKETEHEPGDSIMGVARLQPVLGPAYPGGYDFAFFGRFRGIGGSGFFMGKPKGAGNPVSRSINATDRIKIKLNQFRLAIKKRIERALPGQTGKIAVALVIGDKTGIPADAQDVLRETGLAHILAISGLHMALVALTTVWILRLMFSIDGKWALHYPIKKWSAFGAFVLATGYLMISGFGVATQRAWIMMTVMLFAVFWDRRAITLRNVAISACIILVMDPTSILGPGFQMSFAAVVALVSAYEALNRRRYEMMQRRQNQQVGIVLTGTKKFSSFVAGLFTTSLVAGLATSFISAWHFHQVAPLGLLANVLAMPIVTLIVMPAVLFSITLMPFGMDPIALTLVSHGISLILEVANWVRGLMPVTVIGLQNAVAFTVFLMGFGVLTIFKSRARFIGLALICVIPFVLKTPRVPNILISENGRTVVVKSKNGNLQALIPKRENFVLRIWAKAYSGGNIKSANLPRETCNRDRCIFQMPSGLNFYLIFDPDLLPDACNQADILAAPCLKWVNCQDRLPKLVLKREDFESRGTHAIFISPKSADTTDDTKTKTPKNTKVNAAIAVDTSYRIAKQPWHREPVSYQD